MAFRRRNKSYPFFSQEFLIQNHTDIVFGLVIFILIGLMFEVRFSPFFVHFRLSQLSCSVTPRSIYRCGLAFNQKCAPSKVTRLCRRVAVFKSPPFSSKRWTQFVSLRWLLAGVFFLKQVLSNTKYTERERLGETSKCDFYSGRRATFKQGGVASNCLSRVVSVVSFVSKLCF